jgi:hypothetical protein
LVVVLLPAAANDRGLALTSSFTGMVLAGQLTLGGADEDLAKRLATAAERVLATRPAGRDRGQHAGRGRAPEPLDPAGRCPLRVARYAMARMSCATQS